MGHMVEAELKERGIELVEASEDIASVDPAVAKECVCIDFTWPDSFKANYRFIADHFKAAVVGTTGWNDIKDEVLEYFRKAGTPLIYASNFSIGVNALFAATRRAAEILKGEIARRYHRGRPRRLAGDFLRPRGRSPGHPHCRFPVGLRQADPPPRGVLAQRPCCRRSRRGAPHRDSSRCPRVQRADLTPTCTSCTWDGRGGRGGRRWIRRPWGRQGVRPECR